MQVYPKISYNIIFGHHCTHVGQSVRTSLLGIFDRCTPLREGTFTSLSLAKGGNFPIVARKPCACKEGVAFAGIV